MRRRWSWHTTVRSFYSTVEKECLAIKLTVQTFRVYLLGKPFTIKTDHGFKMIGPCKGEQFLSKQVKPLSTAILVLSGTEMGMLMLSLKEEGEKMCRTGIICI